MTCFTCLVLTYSEKELQSCVRYCVDFSGWDCIDQVLFWAEILLLWEVDLKHTPSALVTSREFAVACNSSLFTALNSIGNTSWPSFSTLETVAG